MSFCKQVNTADVHPCVSEPQAVFPPYCQMHVNTTSNRIHSFNEIIKYTISEEIAILNTSHLQQVALLCHVP